MDEAPLRRNKYNPYASRINVGILSGDALLIKAYQFLKIWNRNYSKNVSKYFSETGAVLCEGQQLDINFENRSNVTYDDYIR
jgi:geranylgeranyl diphosphate synthase type II